MNPAGYQSMAGSGMIPQGPPQPPRNTTQHIQHLVLSQLRSLPPAQGWQATVPINQRANAILQLVTSLRLIQPSMDVTKAVATATSFERTAFTENQDKDSYERAYKQKLSDIAETREKQAKITMQHMQNSQPPPMIPAQQPMQMQGIPTNQNQIQFQQGFSNHLVQQSMRMGVPAALMPQQPQLPMGNSQMNMHHIHQNMHPQMLQHAGQPHLTLEEQGIVTRMAQAFFHAATEEQKNNIRIQMQNMPQEQRQFLQQRRTDTVVHYFRTVATTKYLENKAKMATERANQPIQAPNNGLIPQQARPSSQVQAHAQLSTTQNFEPSFGAGSMNQILGQQQDAMRSQEAGQVVVPASSTQGIPDQQRGNIRGTPQQQQKLQIGGNHQTHQQPTTHYWPNSNANMQQPSQMSIQQQSLNFAQMPQHFPHGQMSGLNNHPRMPPQTATLNQAASPESQNQWPPQRPSQVTQPKEKIMLGLQPGIQPPGAPSLEQPDLSQTRQRPQEMQMKIQQHLALLTEDQKKDFLREYHQRRQQLFMQQQQLQQQQQQQQQHRKEMAAKGTDSEHTDGQKGQNVTQTRVQQPAPHVSNNNLANGTQQSTIPQQPAPIIPGQKPQMTAGAAAQGACSMTEEQTRQMDNCNFPPPILNSDSGSYLSKLPPDIKTWGQLKSWVAQNEHTLPPVTPNKLQHLQAMHYRTLANNQKRQPPQPGLIQHTTAQGFQQPSAPTAPMVPPKNYGQSVTGVNPSQSAFNMMSSIPKPSIKDVQAFRAQWLERMPGLSDEQVEVILMRQKQDFLMKAHQKSSHQHHPVHTLNRNQGQSVQQQFPPSVNHSMQTSKPPTPQRSQSQQNPRSVATTREAVSKETLPNHQVPQTSSQSHPKGVKRNNNNEVVETPVQQDAYRQMSTQPRPNRSQNITETFASSGHDTQRRVQGEHSQAISAQTVTQETKALNTEQPRAEAQKRESRLKQLLAEASRNVAPRQPIQLDAIGRDSMAKILLVAKDHIQNAERTLPRFYIAGGDEELVKKLIHTRLLLLQQCRNTRDYIPADQPSMTPEEAERLSFTLRQGLIHMMHKLKPHTEQPAGQGQTSVTQETNEPTTTLSATNLQQHQLAMQTARQAIVIKNHNSNRAPAAPTSPQPPFAFGAQSPQGLAKYPDKPNGLTQDKLNLPATKKRKGNQVPSASSMSVPSQAPIPSKLAQASKNASQEAQAQPATPPATIKCPIPNCQASSEGFATPIELERHKSEVHGPKEPPIEDPLQWTLQQVRVGIGLGETGKSLPKIKKEVFESPKPKASTSGQGQYSIKQETSTPMTRVPTQTGPSPASNIKTPQASANIKTQSSEIKSDDTQPSEIILKKEITSSLDPWAGSIVSPAAISQAWSSVPELELIGPWSTIQNSLTPASTQSSGKSEKSSPRVSDISENDAVKISLHVEEDSDWLRPDMFEDGLYGDMEALKVDQDMMGMEWETKFMVDELIGSAENGVAIGKGEMTVDNHDWLKLYAPDRMDQSMG